MDFGPQKEPPPLDEQDLKDLLERAARLESRADALESNLAAVHDEIKDLRGRAQAHADRLAEHGGELKGLAQAASEIKGTLVAHTTILTDVRVNQGVEKAKLAWLLAGLMVLGQVVGGPIKDWVRERILGPPGVESPAVSGGAKAAPPANPGGN